MRALLMLALALLLPCTSVAQQSFYKVYDTETPYQGWAEPSLWNTYVARGSGDQSQRGKTFSRDGMWAHSAELEYGVTDWLSLAGYADFQSSHVLGPQFTGGRIEARSHFGSRYVNFVNVGAYAEYSFPRDGFGGQELETRILLDKDYNDWRVVTNPTFSFVTTGREAAATPEFGLSTGVYYRRHERFQPGLELYDNFGTIGAGDPQQHVLFPMATVLLPASLRWETGVGFGLTHSSDKVIVKSILYYEFNAVNPMRLFGRR